MERKLVTSSQVSLPVLVFGNSVFISHLIGLNPLLWLSLHIPVINQGKISKALLYTSRGIPLSSGAHLFSKLPVTFLICSLFNYLPSAVFVVSCDCSLARRLPSSSSLLMSPFVKGSSMYRFVLSVFFVWIPSRVINFVKSGVRFFLPASRMNTSFQGLLTGGK